MEQPQCRGGRQHDEAVIDRLGWGRGMAGSVEVRCVGGGDPTGNGTKVYADTVDSWLRASTILHHSPICSSGLFTGMREWSWLSPYSFALLVVPDPSHGQGQQRSTLTLLTAAWVLQPYYITIWPSGAHRGLGVVARHRLWQWAASSSSSRSDGQLLIRGLGAVAGHRLWQWAASSSTSRSDLYVLIRGSGVVAGRRLWQWADPSPRAQCIDIHHPLIRRASRILLSHVDFTVLSVPGTEVRWWRGLHTCLGGWLTLLPGDWVLQAYSTTIWPPVAHQRAWCGRTVLSHVDFTMLSVPGTEIRWWRGLHTRLGRWLTLLPAWVLQRYLITFWPPIAHEGT